jgi:TusA-related sulfurtransferase
MSEQADMPITLIEALQALQRLPDGVRLAIVADGNTVLRTCLGWLELDGTDPTVWQVADAFAFLPGYKPDDDREVAWSAVLLDDGTLGGVVATFGRVECSLEVDETNDRGLEEPRLERVPLRDDELVGEAGDR